MYTTKRFAPRTQVILLVYIASKILLLMCLYIVFFKFKVPDFKKLE